jgi:hypothetical protein
MQTIHNSENEGTMITINKFLLLSALEAITVFFILIAFKTVRQQHPTGMGEKTGRGIDKRLKESKEALDKAAAHVQSVFEHITNHKT